MLAKMRIQLQEQRGGRTFHHASEVLEDEAGVSVRRATQALRRLRGLDVIPASERSRADDALERALRWVRARPPAGVSGRFSRSFYFSPTAPGQSWRFDIEGLYGTHLQR